MRKLFFALLAAFVLSVPLAVHAAGKGECAGAECQAYRHGIDRKIIPTNDVVCVYFVQAQPGPVVMTIYFGDGRPPRRYVSKYRDHICVGRHFVRDAVKIELCGDSGRAVFFGEDLQRLAHKPKHSREQTACLDGAEACSNQGFKLLEDYHGPLQ